MKSTIIALGAVFLSVVAAQPHRQHQRLHQKRDLEVVWVTDFEIVTETVAVTSTVWVEADGSTTSSESSASTSKPIPDAGQFFQPASDTSQTSTTTTTTSSVAPTSTLSVSSSSSSSSVYVAPPVPTTSSVNVAPTIAAPIIEPAVASTPTTSSVSTTTTQAVLVAAVETSSTPAPAPPAPAPSAPSPSAASSSSSSTGACSPGSVCSGDITYYQAGLGSCGITSDGDTEMVIALSALLMGTVSNGNPYCGKTVTIMSGGNSIKATVVDKCPVCSEYSIDLSNKAFLGLGYDLGVGRTNATWYFN